MEKLTRAIEQSRKALGTLRDILSVDFSVIVRDASILRFEYSFEALWKCLKTYLAVHEGIECASPKSCFRAALRWRGITGEE